MKINIYDALYIYIYIYIYKLKPLDTYFENLDLQCENNSLFQHKSSADMKICHMTNLK